MKRRFMEEQIIGILREQKSGGTVKENTRRHGVRNRVFAAGRRRPAAWRITRCGA